MIPVLWGFGSQWGVMSVQSCQKNNYAWAFPVFQSIKMNLGRDITMGTWKILQYGEE